MADVRAMRTTSKQLTNARAHAWARNRYALFKGKPEDQVISVSNSFTDKPRSLLLQFLLSSENLLPLTC